MAYITLRKIHLFAASLAVILVMGSVRAMDDSGIRSLMAGVDHEVSFEPDNPESVKGIPVNFDNAATTPAFKSVLNAIADEMNTYAAIGRSYGSKSTISTERYNEYRDTVLKFFGADAKRGQDDKYTVIYVNNTTDGINRLSQMLVRDKNDLVITSRMEHHANDLPWRNRATVLHAEVDDHGRLDIDEVQRLLVENAGKVKLVSITAASNVTGYVNDVHDIARRAHKYGAKIVVDGAQIAAHKPFSMRGKTPEEDIDFFVFSAHKLYAPFGGGAIIGLKDELEMAPPAWRGGGNVQVVTDETVRLLEPPDRHEAGSPNYFGVVAMYQAMKEIQSDRVGGFDYLVRHEMQLLGKTVDALRTMPEVVMYNFCTDPACPTRDKCDQLGSERVGLVVFNVKGISSRVVAKELAKKGIATREGAFCAHTYAARLMNVSEDQLKRRGHPPRMIRVSFGIYNSEEEVDYFLDTLKEIIASK